MQLLPPPIGLVSTQQVQTRRLSLPVPPSKEAARRTLVFVASGIAQGVDKVREDHALRTSQRGRQTAFNDPASLAAFDEVGSAPFMFQTHADLAPETLSGGTNRHLPPARTTRHDRHDPHDQRGKPSISVPDTGARRRPSCKASMRRCSSRR